MIVQWTQDLAVNHPIVDEQHKELYLRIDALLEAMQSGKGREKTDETLAFLENYVVEHFGTEERLMDSAAYPSAPGHKQQHREFIGTFGELKRQYNEDGPSSVLAIRLQRVVCDWLRDHIGKTDKALAQFLSA